MTNRTENRGAALIVVIAIMTILLAIALTFFTVSKFDLRTATNVSNGVRADHLTDAAIAIAIAHLNEDLLHHPNVTSLDHGWKTMFNGAWFAGKPWLWKDGVPPWSGGLPQCEIAVLEDTFARLQPSIETKNGGSATIRQLFIVFPDGHRELLYRGFRSSDWLAIPRLESTNMVLYDAVEVQNEDGAAFSLSALNQALQGVRSDLPQGSMLKTAQFQYFDETQLNQANHFPFITPDVYDSFPVVAGLDINFPIPAEEMVADPYGNNDAGPQYARERIHQFTDVDNNDDGLRDSIWIPIPGDRFFPADGVDNDLDGLVDETQDNLIDDDMDGSTDCLVCLQDVVSGAAAEVIHDVDESIEGGVFVYWAGEDNLDNDGDGFVDADDSAANASAPPPYEYSDAFATYPTGTRPTLSQGGLLSAGDEGFFLTAPLPGVEIPIDLNANGIVGEEDDLVPNLSTELLEPLLMRLPETIFVNAFQPETGVYVRLSFSAENVDTIDNDYDLITNDYFAYAFIGPNPLDIFPPFRLTRFSNATDAPYYEVGSDYSATGVNSWISDLTASYNINYYRQGSAFSRPAGAYQLFDYRHTGNWVKGTVDNTSVEDKDLYETALGRMYVEINLEAILDSSGDGRRDTNCTFSPAEADRPALLDDNSLMDYLRVSHSGEPVCELVGRAAVLINDEAAKVNANVAGGYTYYDDFDKTMPSTSDDPRTSAFPGPILQRAFADGTTPAEYETRVLPGIGDVKAKYLQGARMGSPAEKGVVGDSGSYETPGTGAVAAPALEDYRFDISLPGYGLIDDNQNAFMLAFNGVDDDGDGLVDEGIRIPTPADSDYYLLDLYEENLGRLEGVDEPGEFRRLAPYRNLLAEADGVDNDYDGVVDEFGELGDRPFENLDQIGDVYGIAYGGESHDKLKNLLTVHGAARNVSNVQGEKGLRAASKLDLNFANAQQIAAHMVANKDFNPITERTIVSDHPKQLGLTRPLIGELAMIDGTDDYAIPAKAYAEGLRQADIHIEAPDTEYSMTTASGPLGITNDDTIGGILHSRIDPLNAAVGTTFSFPADPLLQAMQAAVDTVDKRDSNHGRSRLSTENTDLLTDEEEAGLSNWPEFVPERERIPAKDLFPLEEIEEYMEKSLGVVDRVLQSVDEWWLERVVGADGSGNEQRHISYTTTGIEAIRINELMVRPVRRVEAEATPEIVNHPDDYDINFDPSPWARDASGVWEDPLLPSDPTAPLSSIPFAANTPEFMFQRRDMGDVLSDNGSSATPNWGIPFGPLQGKGFYGNFLGDLTYYETTDRFAGGLTVLSDNTDVSNPVYSQDGQVPNAMEFLFVASEGLPAGRYYLTVNVSGILGDALVSTVNDGVQLRYAIKYVGIDKGTYISTGEIAPLSTEPTILEDLMTEADDVALVLDPAVGIYDDPLTPDVNEATAYWLNESQMMKDYFMPLPLAHVGLGADGMPEGWAFLDGRPKDLVDAIASTIPAAGSRETWGIPGTADHYYEDGIYFNYPLDGTQGFGYPDLEPTNANGTHTVYVPDPLTDGFALCVALVKDPDPTYVDRALSINFFDFSQEPDHEFIELVNVSNEPVDMSGWELEIGYPKMKGATEDPFRSLWKMPDGVTIGANSTLLCCFDEASGVDSTPTKMDRFQDQNSYYDANLINTNGMGLIAGVDPDAPSDFFTNITVPPIVDTAADRDFSDLFYDPTGSVFQRYDDLNTSKNEAVEYIDNDGDGYSTRFFDTDGDGVLEDPLDIDGDGDTEEITSGQSGFPDLDGASEELLLNSTQGGPWDRIVTLENIRLFREDPASQTSARITIYDMVDHSTDIDKLARLVLSGGVLPNYPEHDGHDNDGDGGWLDETYTYQPGILDLDMVDNDGDGYIDERGYSYDIDGDGFVDAPWGAWDIDGDTVPDDVLEANPYPSEGVDEGRRDRINSNRPYGAGSFETGILPVVFFNDREVYPPEEDYEEAVNAYFSTVITGIGTDPANLYLLFEEANFYPANLGIYAYYDFETSTELSYTAAQEKVWRVGDFAVNSGAPDYIKEDGMYLGCDNDPPEWKAFTERRWYPGDAVFVTLYAGDSDADDAQVVDRVSYTELDVTNRTVDDIMPSPYFVSDYHGNAAGYEFNDVVSLNPSYPSFWLPNQMALDFYRSLERKHPLYNGDRFGTRNRWEATDGNYDDWAESQSFWLRELYQGVGFPFPVLDYNSGNLDYYGYLTTVAQDRYDPIALDESTLSADEIIFEQERRERLFRHAFYASPLRMNLSERIGENPEDLYFTLAKLEVYDIAAYNDRLYNYKDGRPTGQFNADSRFNILQRNLNTGSNSVREELKNLDWNLEKAVLDNRAYTSPGDLNLLPHVVYRKYLQCGALLSDPGLLSRYRSILPMSSVNTIMHTRPGDNAQEAWRLAMQDVDLRSGTIGQDESDADYSPNLGAALVDSVSANPLVLTVGQATVKQIRPELNTVSFPSGENAADARTWRPADTDWINKRAPAVWSPVYFAVFGSDPAPDTSTYLSGLSLAGYPASYSLPRFLDDQVLYDTAFTSSGGLSHYSEAEILARWPIDDRAMMYVCELGQGYYSDEAGKALVRPEALFEWDIDDGLENGVYLLYIGTFTPGLSERIDDTVGYLGTAYPGMPIFGLDDTTDDDDNFTLDILRNIDPTNPLHTTGQRAFASDFAIDVITDRTKASAMSPRLSDVTTATNETIPGLAHPDDWQPYISYQADENGYIFFGNSAQGGWKPQLVQVKDHYLALRIRHMGEVGEVGVINHVVLAPAKYSSGKINVNTTEYQRVLSAGDSSQELFNPLHGLPGIFDIRATAPDYALGIQDSPYSQEDYFFDPYLERFALRWPIAIDWSNGSFLIESPSGNAAAWDAVLDVDPPTLPVPNNDSRSPWAPIYKFAGDLQTPPGLFDLQLEDTSADPYTDDALLVQHEPAGSNETSEWNQTMALRLGSMITGARLHHSDGRYYEKVIDLTRDSSMQGQVVGGVNTYYPLSNVEDDETRFDEAVRRFRSLSNAITTRSDIYEIIVTVQAGYGVDANFDGWLNYRSAQEFVTTAETTGRVVYERRAPADHSDQAD